MPLAFSFWRFGHHDFIKLPKKKTSILFLIFWKPFFPDGV